MRMFADYNPIAVAVYFLAVAGIAMFSMDPVILAISLAGALCFYFVRNGRSGARSHLYALALFAGMALINPIVSHNGATVLFVVNHNPITLEAFVYGVAASTMIISTLYWFRSFSQIMTSDRLLYLFGAISPRLALILSMALRYVPLFGVQARRVGQAQKALGLYKEDNIVDRFRSGMRIFSVMVTWALENGIVTADSMTARGYGIGKRSRFSLFRFTLGDGVLLGLALSLAGCALLGLSGRDFEFYPVMKLSPLTARALAGYISYGILAFLPTIINVKEAVRWSCLRSSI